MFTNHTIEALQLIKAIEYRTDERGRNGAPALTRKEIHILHQLERGGLVGRRADDTSSIDAWELLKPFASITLFDVLSPLGEGIVPLSAADSEARIYDRYGCTGRKLGVINTCLRIYLTEIRVAELQIPDAGGEEGAR